MFECELKADYQINAILKITMNNIKFVEAGVYEHDWFQVLNNCVCQKTLQLAW